MALPAFFSHHMNVHPQHLLSTTTNHLEGCPRELNASSPSRCTYNNVKQWIDWGKGAAPFTAPQAVVVVAAISRGRRWPGRGGNFLCQLTRYDRLICLGAEIPLSPTPVRQPLSAWSCTTCWPHSPLTNLSQEELNWSNLEKHSQYFSWPS